MATLQDEMQRFLTARFGEDVRDAFVSCIRKIHAENMAFADEADALTQQMETTLNQANIAINQKVDGAYVENGYLYLTANGEIVAGPIGPFAGSGGGGGSGGGDSGNNAAMTVTNSSGWLTKTIALGNSCPISITWYSLEDEIPTGNGIMKIMVNGITRATVDIQQGNITHDLKDYVSAGANNVRVTISDIYGNSRTINFNVDVKDISLSSDFDPATPYTGFITFPYTPVGNVEKVIHFVVDGTEIDTLTTTSSGRRLEFDISPQSHGSHTIEVWFDCEINSSVVESNHVFSPSCPSRRGTLLLSFPAISTERKQNSLNP